MDTGHNDAGSWRRRLHKEAEEITLIWYNSHPCFFAPGQSRALNFAWVRVEDKSWQGLYSVYIICKCESWKSCFELGNKKFT